MMIDDFQVGAELKWLGCDEACDETYAYVRSVAPHSRATFAFVRKCAAEDGWVSVGRKDYCPSCAELHRAMSQRKKRK